MTQRIRRWDSACERSPPQKVFAALPVSRAGAILSSPFCWYGGVFSSRRPDIHLV